MIKKEKSELIVRYLIMANRFGNDLNNIKIKDILQNCGLQKSSLYTIDNFDLNVLGNNVYEFCENIFFHLIRKAHFKDNEALKEYIKKYVEKNKDGLNVSVKNAETKNLMKSINRFVNHYEMYSNDDEDLKDDIVSIYLKSFLIYGIIYFATTANDNPVLQDVVSRLYDLL